MENVAEYAEPTSDKIIPEPALQTIIYEVESESNESPNNPNEQTIDQEKLGANDSMSANSKSYEDKPKHVSARTSEVMSMSHTLGYEEIYSRDPKIDDELQFDLKTLNTVESFGNDSDDPGDKQIVQEANAYEANANVKSTQTTQTHSKRRPHRTPTDDSQSKRRRSAHPSTGGYYQTNYIRLKGETIYLDIVNTRSTKEI